MSHTQGTGDLRSTDELTRITHWFQHSLMRLHALISFTNTYWIC